jgi:tetratricopeptide (TPR) repeat protein
MNLERLNEIYRNPVTINNSDVDDLRQLVKDYPYFAKPFEILARYYYQTNHYRFEEMLRQAAIRVRDRKLLYEFIHSEIPQAQEIKIENIVEPEERQVSIIETSQPEDTKLGLEAFLTEVEVVPQSEELKTEELELGSAETVETPFEFEGTFKLHETVNTPDEQDIIGEEIATEFSFTKSFVQNEAADESQLPEVEDEVVSIESELETEEEQAIELITEEETAIEDLGKEEEIESISENTELEKETLEVSNKSSELDLRKYPVYSIEAFVPQTEEQASTETDSSKDFFSWLKNPKHTEETPQVIEELEEEIAIEPNEKVTKSLDIIEKFISINPQISRPKKEFFSPENMAKRSEVLDLEFVSETLAEIYYQQGNFDFAIKAYEKLSLQNPSKQSFFADLIDKIKKERK